MEGNYNLVQTVVGHVERILGSPIRCDERYDQYSPILEKRIIGVGSTTHIDMLEGDLSQFIGPPTSEKMWDRMVKRWIDQGASVDILVQDINPDVFPKVEDLHRGNPGLRLFDISGYRGGDVSPDQLERLRTFHFTLVDEPRQFWLEYSHPVRGLAAYDCEYVNADIFKGDKRYNKLVGIMAALKNGAQEIPRPSPAKETH